MLAKAGLLDLKAAAFYTRLPINKLRHRRNTGLLQPKACELLPNGSWRHLYHLDDLAPLIATEAACPPPSAPPARRSSSSSAA